MDEEAARWQAEVLLQLQADRATRRHIEVSRGDDALQRTADGGLGDAEANELGRHREGAIDGRMEESMDSDGRERREEGKSDGEREEISASCACR